MVEDYGEPIHVVPLVPGKWDLVITSRGRKFYHNRLTAVNQWVLEDAEASKALEAMDKDELVMLIAWCRGLRVGNADMEPLRERYFIRGDAVPRAEVPKRAVAANVGSRDDPEEAEGGSVFHVEEHIDRQSSPAAIGAVSGLGSMESKGPGSKISSLVGYGSSDEEEESGEEQDEADEADGTGLVEGQALTEVEIQAEEEEDGQAESDDNLDTSSDSDGGVDFSLSDLESDEEADKESKSTDIDSFKQLFEDYNINPMGSFELQVKLFAHDPRYFKIDDPALQRKVFDLWCKETLAKSANSRGDVDVLSEAYHLYPYLKTVDYLNDKYDKALGEKKLYLFEFKKRFTKTDRDIIADSTVKFDKVYKEYIFNHFNKDYLSQVKPVIAKTTGAAAATAGLNEDNLVEYYTILDRTGLLADEGFMNDVRFQSLPLNTKINHILRLL